jgi:hypothetical protein
MTVLEAKEKIAKYCANPLRMNEEDCFILNELCKFVYEETGDTTYLIVTSSKRITDPKYLEKIYLLSIENGQECNCYLLANLYASGRLGSFDYEKAYEYYLRAAKTKKQGSGKTMDDSVTDYHNTAKLKLAEMYKNGLYVKKDYDRYKKIVNEVYEEIRELEWYDYRYEELFAKAKLELEEGNSEEGLEILYLAREELWRLLKYIQERSEYEFLDEMNSCLYRCQEIDYTEIGPEDITELLKKPLTISFLYDDIFYKIRSYKDGEDMVIEFEGDLYRDSIDFIMKARVGDTWFREMLFNSDMWEVRR